MMMIKMIILSSPVDVVPVPLLPGLLVKLKKKLKEKTIKYFDKMQNEVRKIQFGRLWKVLANSHVWRDFSLPSMQGSTNVMFRDS